MLRLTLQNASLADKASNARPAHAIDGVSAITRAIATEGSLTKAAQNLKLSQSALSVQLRSLEENLGQPLFERKHKALVLTETGCIELE
jgi:hypothetical protein